MLRRVKSDEIIFNGSKYIIVKPGSRMCNFKLNMIGPGQNGFGYKNFIYDLPIQENINRLVL